MSGIGSSPIAEQPISSQGINNNAGGLQGSLDELSTNVEQLQDLIIQLSNAQAGQNGWLD